MSGKEHTEFDAKVLVVDDDPGTRELLETWIDECGWEPHVAEDGFEALAKAKLDYDIVLLDVNLPGMDGYEIAKRFKEDYPDTPIIMVTGQDSREDRLRAVEAGAEDFIGKPVDMTELRVRIRSQLEKKQAFDQLKEHEAELEDKVEERTSALRDTLEELAESKRAIQDAYVEAINRLARAAEFKDAGTGSHIERVGGCVQVLAQNVGLPPGKVEVLQYASRMHDVGKVGIPDAILLKPDELQGDEWEKMKTHTTLGRRILSGSSSEILQAGEVVAEFHHERWDGTGYPRGMEGESIPIEGRICALADVFDALVSDRPYREAYSIDKALHIMKKGRGSHFDPELFDLFESHLEEIIEAGNVESD